MGFKNSRYCTFIKQNISQMDLNLSNYNVLVPVFPEEPALPVVIAHMAGAKNIFVKTSKFGHREAVLKTCSEFCIENVQCSEFLPAEFLGTAHIALAGYELAKIDSNFVSSFNKKGVISLLPDNLDFTNTDNVDMKAFGMDTCSIIGLNPENPYFNLYNYFSQILLKRVFEVKETLYKTNILLVGHAGFLEASTKILNSTGANVYICNTDNGLNEQNYYKHLHEMDIVIIADYPVKTKQALGSKGCVQIGDIVDLCPHVKVIHFAGNIEENSLNLAEIAYFPDKILQNSTNLNISELGQKAYVEIISGCFKAAEAYLKSQSGSMNSNNSIVIYKRLNKAHPVLLDWDKRLI